MVRSTAAATASMLAVVIAACIPPREAVSSTAGTEVLGEGRSIESYADLGIALRGDPELARIIEEAERRRVQILIADASSANGLARAGFRVDAEYFYPASAVKLCAAVAAVEKIAELRAARSDVSLATPLRITFASERTRSVDTTVANELERALVISDNDAFNRLLGLVGEEELAWRLQALGLRSARVVHRLGDPGDPPDPAFELRPPSGVMSLAQRVGIELSPASATPVGSAHVDGDGRLIEMPFDFGEKNRISLRDLQDLLVAVVRPELSDLAPPRWSNAERESLVVLLGRLPSDPPYGLPRAFDDRMKPLAGAVRAALPGHDVRVYAKAGRAYGFTVENAYVVDATTGRAVFVTATIYANDNETINDDRYEYESVADPFVGALGRFVARAYLRGP